MNTNIRVDSDLSSLASEHLVLLVMLFEWRKIRRADSLSGRWMYGFWWLAVCTVDVYSECSHEDQKNRQEDGWECDESPPESDSRRGSCNMMLYNPCLFGFHRTCDFRNFSSRETKLETLDMNEGTRVSGEDTRVCSVSLLTQGHSADEKIVVVDVDFLDEKSKTGKSEGRKAKNEQVRTTAPQLVSERNECFFLRSGLLERYSKIRNKFRKTRIIREPSVWLTQVFQTILWPLGECFKKAKFWELASSKHFHFPPISR